MASVFKRGRDQGKRRAHWYVSYTDHLGRRRTKKGFTDKTLTEQLGAKLENEAMLRVRGLIDPEDERIAGQKATLLSVHLEAFHRSLAPNSEKYVKLLMNRLRRLVRECEFAVAGDIDPELVTERLTALREKEKFGHRTYNHYVQALDAFCNWCVPKRMPCNPIAGMERLNTEVDVRHPRRALLPDEVWKMVESARTSGKIIQSFDGEQRARVYICSYMTGLRRKELASLTPRSFDFVSNPPLLTVQATASKHRKKDVLPLHPELADMARAWSADLLPDDCLFPLLDRKKTWLMVKKDLERIGIPYQTADGIADFHAAGRHSHVTELLRSGASLPEARELARHSDIRTTMKYTHSGMDDRARALGNLRWQRIGSGARDVHGHRVASNDNGTSPENAGKTDESDGKSRTCDTPSRPLATDGNDSANRRTRVRFSPPPLCKSLKDKELPERPSGLAASGRRRAGAACPSMASFDAVVAASSHCDHEYLSPAVAQIAAAWLGLPPHIREAILTLVDAGRTRNKGAASLTSLCSGSVPDRLPQGARDTREIAWQLTQQCRSIV